MVAAVVVMVVVVTVVAAVVARTAVVVIWVEGPAPLLVPAGLPWLVAVVASAIALVADGGCRHWPR